MKMLMAVCLLLTFLQVAPHSGTKQQRPAARKEEPIEKTPPSVAAPVKEETPKPKTKEEVFKPEAKRPEAPPWWDVAWSTWALVVVGVVAAYIALGTLSDIRKQTEVSKIAADAARKSAEVAEQTLHLTQSADVQIVGMRLTPAGPLTANTVIEVQVKNFGQSRAKQFVNDLTVGIQGRELAPVHARQYIGVVLGPGQPFTIGFEPLGPGKILTQDDVQRVLNGELFLKIWGSLKYEDVFGKLHVVKCEGTYDRVYGNFLIDRYEPADE
jgi:hypothetical protein